LDGNGQPLFPPEHCADWDGSYFSNSWQLVTPEDARAIADALERALGDRPNGESSSEPVGPREELLAGTRRRLVEQFIAYCRAGRFFIS
jgi:hypothetical protein